MYFLSLLFGVTLIGMAMSEPNDERDDRDADDVRHIERELAQAAMRNDTDYIERVTSDDLVCSGVGLAVKTKPQLVAQLRAGELRFDALRLEDVQVRVHKQTAVVTGVTAAKGNGPAGRISGKFRYARVYDQRSGKWRVVAYHTTPMPA